MSTFGAEGRAETIGGPSTTPTRSRHSNPAPEIAGAAPASLASRWSSAPGSIVHAHDTTPQHPARMNPRIAAHAQGARCHLVLNTIDGLMSSQDVLEAPVAIANTVEAGLYERDDADITK